MQDLFYLKREEEQSTQRIKQTLERERIVRERKCTKGSREVKVRPWKMNQSLDVRQSQEVLGDVNNKLVHESRSNVKPIHHVVQVVLPKGLG
jgi:hypothetical protein